MTPPDKRLRKFEGFGGKSRAPLVAIADRRRSKERAIAVHAAQTAARDAGSSKFSPSAAAL
jgi:hypothetical protein